MPTVTEPATRTRRQWLQGMALLAAWPTHPWAQAAQAPRWAAAWAVGPDLFVGVLQAPATATDRLQVVQAHAIPTRAHGMTQ